MDDVRWSSVAQYFTGSLSVRLHVPVALVERSSQFAPFWGRLRRPEDLRIERAAKTKSRQLKNPRPSPLSLLVVPLAALLQVHKLSTTKIRTRVAHSVTLPATIALRAVARGRSEQGDSSVSDCL